MEVVEPFGPRDPFAEMLARSRDPCGRRNRWVRKGPNQERSGSVLQRTQKRQPRVRSVVHEHPGRVMGSDGESEEASGASDDVAHHHNHHLHGGPHQGGHRTSGSHLSRNPSSNLNSSSSNSSTSNGGGAAQQGPVQVCVRLTFKRLQILLIAQRGRPADQDQVDVDERR
ncbi:hypothetical protein BIW11_00601 [Tropilaelaps mercedesae]|uniref:Uncharacterized protein n=1 Tax=Tropilaelaps mercedesae TaxID=418985 RepID=A0A1V9XSC8_9ACAR|nr:hypothetical protein BIW11_00601 [Tropilaelaps mercedesae]